MSKETEIQSERILQTLQQIESDGSKFANGDPEARQRLIAGARELISAAETPVETLLWNVWAMPTRTVATRVAIDLKLFETASGDNGSPKTNKQLAAATGASPTLVKRITRICASKNMLEEVTPGVYAPNSLTRLLAQPNYAAGVVFCFDATQKSFAHLPEYLRANGFQNPENALDGPFHFLAFHGYVHTLRNHRPSWTDIYPVQTQLVEGLQLDGDASTLIDVGGGVGQNLQDFTQDVPQYKGQLVLQELPGVIGAAKAAGVGDDQRIELQEHDFFTPQPIRGARAYFLRSVLHDWPDEQCRQILGNLKDVMTPGYSKILLSECILADQKPAWQHISLDLYMLGLASSQERTESEWYKLIESCGLKIAGIYNKGEGNEGLIEVVCK